jgi:DNA-directed RNA polymerase subunit M/transcription elongation factor TFIIS
MSNVIFWNIVNRGSNHIPLTPFKGQSQFICKDCSAKEDFVVLFEKGTTVFFQCTKCGTVYEGAK